MYLHLLESLGRVGGGDMRPRGDDDGGGFNSLALRLQAFLHIGPSFLQSRMEKFHGIFLFLPPLLLLYPYSLILASPTPPVDPEFSVRLSCPKTS